MNAEVNIIENKGFYSNTKSNLILSINTFYNWRKFIYDSCGIYFLDNKKYLLESRLLKRMNYLNIQSFEEYLDYLKYNVNRNSERKYLYDVITINETFFFRNQPQLDAMIGGIFPELIASKTSSGNKRIKIWSAASSSGEEAFSIAISIKEFIQSKHPDFKFEIVGTDINNTVIETAKRGIYKEYAVRNTSEYYLRKYFNRIGSNVFELSPEIRQAVTFKNINLYDKVNMKLMFGFDVIICANVLIYFDQQSKIKVVSDLYNSLLKDGYLLIGYSETLHNISNAFQVVNFPKTIAYKK